MKVRVKISRRQFGSATALGLTAVAETETDVAAASRTSQADTSSLPGLWRFSFGTPEALTPVRLRHYPPALEGLRQLTAPAKCPIDARSITARVSKRGYEVTLPLAAGELVYGLGLQFKSFLQRGLKKKLRVNADPIADLGDSHAPVPFYVTTHGYAVLIDTARYLNIYCGNKVKKRAAAQAERDGISAQSAASGLPQAYQRYHIDQPSRVIAEIPQAQGVDIYIFAGPTMREAVQRYNLFAGGGVLPPRWGLGFWYRCYGQFTQDEVLALARDLRQSEIACDVLGLEPGWQSHSYSCSFTWSDKFPQPEHMLHELDAFEYRVNLWEHAFTHPSSPLHGPLMDYSGDYEVWDGLVPDFVGTQARRIFGEYHERELVAKGVSAFKLDECDNSDYTGAWSFPESSQFPSGADGEQMHCLFGLKYQETIQAAFERYRVRTLGLVRSSHALASPYPYALYSDLYDHREFIRGIANAGFAGLLWCPEVRDAKNTEDLLRRLQTVVFSPVAMINTWYIRNPPWKQVDREKNNAGEFADGWKETEAACRKLIELRMQFVPYLYAAFVRYYRDGRPPFRALVLDYPEDKETWLIDNQYLMGEDLLVAPLVAGETGRDVYLPDGEWIDFSTGQTHQGKQTIKPKVAVEQIPVFVKNGTLLPLAQPTLHTSTDGAFELTVRVYGNGDRSCTLYEDDGSISPTFTNVALIWEGETSQGSLVRSGPEQKRQYRVKDWHKVPA
jgi:alpha-D-xyloside xylohydrolase